MSMTASVVWAGIPSYRGQACLPAGREQATQIFQLKFTCIKTKNPGISPGLLWCEPGLNRRHMDFQSIALPTELPHHLFSVHFQTKVGIPHHLFSVHYPTKVGIRHHLFSVHFPTKVGIPHHFPAFAVVQI